MFASYFRVPENRRPVARRVVAAAIVIAPAISAAADDALETAVRACARLSNSSERLVCYDRKVASLVGAGEGAAEAAPPSEEMFGISPAVTEPQPEAPARSEELSEITAKVTAVRTVGRSVAIELDNGHVWRTDEDRPLLLKPGDTVTIARAALGTFRMTTPTQRSARVRRVR